MDEHKPLFDDYSKDYKNLVSDSINFSGLTVDFFTKGKADYIQNLINKYQVKTVLDVGCGVGDIHGFFQGNGCQVTGVDVSGESIQIAQEKNTANTYLTYNGEKLPFDDDAFDMVYTICVMHHVPPAQWQDFVHEMVRVTKNGGVVAVFEHNPFNPLTRIAVNRCPFDADAVLLSSGKVEKLFKNTKAIQPKSEFIFFTPFKSVLGKVIDKIFYWLPLGAQYYTYGKVSK